MNNTVNINDENFKNSEVYQNFLKNNPATGNLIIRAYAANEAIPIRNLKVVVSLEIDGYNVIFFDGVTDDSGMIPRLSLPAPGYNPDNLVAPLFTTYDVSSNYMNLNYNYKVNIYDNICVVQNINVIPEINGRVKY